MREQHDAIFEKMNISRREFTEIGCKVIIGAATGSVIIKSLVKNSIAVTNLPDEENYDWNEHYWGFVVDNYTVLAVGIASWHAPTAQDTLTRKRARTTSHTQILAAGALINVPGAIPGLPGGFCLRASR